MPLKIDDVDIGLANCGFHDIDEHRQIINCILGWQRFREDEERISAEDLLDPNTRAAYREQRLQNRERER